MSFLEFKIPEHMEIFKNGIHDNDENKVINQFMDRDALYAWAEELSLKVLKIYDGNVENIYVNDMVEFDDGPQYVEKAKLGQSVCILTKL